MVIGLEIRVQINDGRLAGAQIVARKLDFGSRRAGLIFGNPADVEFSIVIQGAWVVEPGPAAIGSYLRNCSRRLGSTARIQKHPQTNSGKHSSSDTPSGQIPWKIWKHLL